MENARGEDGVGFARAAAGVYALKFFRRCERQPAFTVEEFFQPSVAGTAFAPDDFRRDAIAQFAAMTPPFQPIFVADHVINRDAGDF